MEPQPSVPQDIQGPGATSYTVSLTARACLRALQLAAWIEAMVLAHHTADPQGAGSWLWFVGRCALFTFGSYMLIGVLVQIAKRRSTRGGGPRKLAHPEPREVSGAGLELLFDPEAYEATAGALLFHFGAPIWMWIFA